jgi:hypothetical protein
MANFELGQVVVNFGTTAKVVGFFRSADGSPSEHDGQPILRQVGPNGRLRGGKWVADPTKCEVGR